MKTKDFGLGCLLAANKCMMTSKDMDERGRVWMTFEDTPDVERLVQDFYSGNATVNVSDFLSMHKQLKTLIYTLRGDENERLTHEKRSRKYTQSVCMS